MRLITGRAATRIEAGRVILDDGLAVDAEIVIASTGSAAAARPAQAGLACDAGGFIRVNTFLQSVSHPFVFAAGDCATMDDHPRPKSGVYAVRAGPPLAANLRQFPFDNPMKAYTPQRNSLYLISTGSKHAIGSWGSWAWRAIGCGAGRTASTARSCAVTQHLSAPRIDKIHLCQGFAVPFLDWPLRNNHASSTASKPQRHPRRSHPPVARRPVQGRNSLPFPSHSVFATTVSPPPLRRALNVIAICQAAHGRYIEAVSHALDTYALAHDAQDRIEECHALATLAASAGMILDTDEAAFRFFNIVLKARANSAMSVWRRACAA